MVVYMKTVECRRVRRVLCEQRDTQWSCRKRRLHVTVPPKHNALVGPRTKRKVKTISVCGNLWGFSKRLGSGVLVFTAHHCFGLHTGGRIRLHWMAVSSYSSHT